MPDTQHSVTSSVVTITPQKAANWLDEANVKNRRLRSRKVDELSDAITRGEWRLDGSPIRFSKEGKLLDGQHRLEAIRKAGKPVKALVVRGLDDSAQEVMDRTLARTFGDKLYIDEEKNSTTLASAVNILWRFENSAFGKDAFGKKKPSFAQLDDVLARHPEVRRAVAVAGTQTKKIKMPRAYIAAARVIFLSIDEADADHFFAELVAGVEMAKTDPIFRLRETLNDNAMSKSRTYSSDHLLALTFKAWNLYRRGETCQILAYRAGGVAPEAFPIPV